MKTLIIFWGETYRSGPQMTDIRGTGNYIKRQIIASKSHIKLVKLLSETGHIVDTLITSYKLNEKDDNDLIDFYTENSNLINHKLFNGRFPSEIVLFDNIFGILKEVILNNEYDNLLFVRIDLYLKNLFLNDIVNFPKDIMFVHIDSNVDVNISFFNICQQIFTIPKKHFGLLLNNVLIGHHPHGFKDVMISAGVPLKDITYLTDTLHVCSTDLGWNPYYIQVGREYNKEYHIGCNSSRAVEHYYDKECNCFIRDLNKTIYKWSSHLNEDSLYDILDSLNESNFKEITN